MTTQILSVILVKHDAKFVNYTSFTDLNNGNATKFTIGDSLITIFFKRMIDFIIFVKLL